MNLLHISQNISSYLGQKVPSSEIVDFIKTSSECIDQLIKEFDMCINSFNKFRILSKFPNKSFYKNSQQLNQIFMHDLPKFKTIFKKLESDPELSKQIFKLLANDSYLVQIWQVRPINLLLPNILLLIYRSTILFLNKEILMDNQGCRKVQISSVIEEMVYCNYLLGDKFEIYDALSLWLEDWQEEGFDERLYLAVKNNRNVLQ